MTEREIERCIVPGEDDGKVLVAAGGKRGRDVKFVMKGLDRAVSEHSTLKITENARFYLHLTKETKTKEYTPLVKGKIDVEQLKERAEALLEKSAKTNRHKRPRTRRLHSPIPRYDNAYQEFEKRFHIKAVSFTDYSKAIVNSLCLRLQRWESTLTVLGKAL